MSERFYVFDSDNNPVMEQKGYASLADAVEAASYLVVYVWPDPERATVGREPEGVVIAEAMAYVEACEPGGNGPDGATLSAGVTLETATARGARVPRVTYTAAGIDALTRALPHDTFVCQVCGSHDVHATAWVDSANVVMEGDGPLDSYYCNGCNRHSPDETTVLAYSPGDEVPPHTHLRVESLSAPGDVRELTLAEFVALDLDEDDDAARATVLALAPGESATVTYGSGTVSVVTRLHKKGGAS